MFFESRIINTSLFLFCIMAIPIVRCCHTERKIEDFPYEHHQSLTHCDLEGVQSHLQNMTTHLMCISLSVVQENRQVRLELRTNILFLIPSIILLKW